MSMGNCCSRCRVKRLCNVCGSSILLRLAIAAPTQALRKDTSSSRLLPDKSQPSPRSRCPSMFAGGDVLRSQLVPVYAITPHVMAFHVLRRRDRSEQFVLVEHTTFSVSDNPELRLVLFLAAGRPIRSQR
jgi:hypothetical protein